MVSRAFFGLISVIIGTLILVHQWLQGTLWDWSQFLHHETFASIAYALGAGILIASWRRKS